MQKGWLLHLRNILILSNTYIQNTDSDYWLCKLEEKLKLAKVCYKIFINDSPLSLTEYSELIILGGDGSVNYVLNKYPQINIPISIIPLGTGNDLYAVLNQNINLEESLDTAINGEAQPIDAGICNGKLFVNTFSVGYDAQVVFDSIMVPKILRKFKYIIAIIKNLLFYNANSYIINTEDKSIKYTQLTLMNGPRYGRGITISPKSNPSDGKMELIMLAEVTGFFAKLKLLLKLKQGTHIYDKLCECRSINDKISIHCSENINYQLDGESYTGNCFMIEILPKYFAIKTVKAH